jgi:branched-chain amino acid transport system substrate-binding protein
MKKIAGMLGICLYVYVRSGEDMSMVKMLSRLLVLTVLVSILCTGCSQTTPPLQHNVTQPMVITLGAIVGLSGDISVYGASQKKGLELAVQEINDSNYLGAGKKLELIIEDSGATVDGAVSAMTRLLAEDDVVGVIGPTLSSQAFAADPIAQKHGIPVMGISNTVPNITKMGDFIFRCSLPESVVIAGTIKSAVQTLKIKKVGILWESDDDYTIGCYQAFMESAKQNGLSIVAQETFVGGETDFEARISRIIARQPDAILVSAFAREAPQIVIQLRGLNFTGTVIGGNGFNTPDIITRAREAAEGIMVGTAWNKASRASNNVTFISSFEKAYSITPDQFAAQAYTGVWLYANAIRIADSPEPRAIRDALAGTRNFDTPLGLFSFTGEREPLHKPAVQVIRHGQFVILD